MIQFLSHQDIDQSRWDLCIEQSVNGLIYGYSWYLNEMAPGWNALVWGDYEAVMPLTGNRKLFIKYLYQPYFMQQLGVFYTRWELKSRVIDFIEAIPPSYRFIDINLNEHNEVTVPNGMKLKKRKNFVLDLHHEYAALEKRFDDHCSRNIKKAYKQQQTIAQIDPALAVAFYQKYKAMATSNVLDSDYEQFLAVLLKAQERQLLLCRGVYNASQELLAVGIYYIHKGRIIYVLGGASDAGRESRSMYYLFDDVIRNFSGLNMLLDFEGSEIPGIARFFKGFGARKQPYFKLHVNRLPWFVRWLK